MSGDNRAVTKVIATLVEVAFMQNALQSHQEYENRHLTAVSELAFRGRLFTRQNMIQASREILESEWNQIQDRFSSEDAISLDAFYRQFDAKLDKVKST